MAAMLFLVQYVLVFGQRLRERDRGFQRWGEDKRLD